MLPGYGNGVRDGVGAYGMGGYGICVGSNGIGVYGIGVGVLPRQRHLRPCHKLPRQCHNGAHGIDV